MDRTRAGLGGYLPGVGTSVTAAVREARSARVNPRGVLFPNPSFGFIPDLFESAVQKFLPGVAGIDQFAGSIIADAGRAGRLVGHSQGSMTLTNSLIYAAATGGGRVPVRETVHLGSPRNHWIARGLVAAGTTGGSFTFNPGSARFTDPIAGLGNPLNIHCLKI